MGVLDEPFRGSEAVRLGRVSADALRGPRFRRLFPDVYYRADGALDLANRSKAAFLLIAGHGALAGYSAAELLGARCAPRDADAEIVVPGRDFRERCGLRVHRDRLADDEVVEIGHALLTSPLRTAYDLARWLPLTEAVAAVDALARCREFDPKQVLDIYDRYAKARWRRRVPRVVALSDPGAESAMETRCRLALVLNRLPAPISQYRVFDADDLLVARLDLAYPHAMLGIEYDGAHHRGPAEFANDQRRDNRLKELGWTVLRVNADELMGHPARLVRQVRALLSAASRSRRR